MEFDSRRVSHVFLVLILLCVAAAVFVDVVLDPINNDAVYFGWGAIAAILFVIALAFRVHASFARQRVALSENAKNKGPSWSTPV